MKTTNIHINYTEFKKYLESKYTINLDEYTMACNEMFNEFGNDRAIKFWNPQLENLLDDDSINYIKNNYNDADIIRFFELDDQDVSWDIIDKLDESKFVDFYNNFTANKYKFVDDDSFDYHHIIKSVIDCILIKKNKITRKEYQNYKSPIYLEISW